jgi:hypothetical protein
MLTPPSDPGWISILAESGVDEIGFNIEVFSDRAARRHLAAKRGALPLVAYERALRRAVAELGAVNTRSIMVVGLEDEPSLLRGVDWLAGMGVMPILSPLRPLNGTSFEGRAPWPASRLLDVSAEAAAVAGRYTWEVDVRALARRGSYTMPLGPLCVACQGNTLTPSKHPLYGHY